jgi:hypothetical protein
VLAAPARTVSPGLSGTVQGFSWALGALSLVTAMVALAALATFDRYWDAPINSRAEADAYDDWLVIDDVYGAFGGMTFVCGLVVFILLVVWTHQLHEVSQQLWTGERRWSSGWSVGAWFVPLANAVLPKLVLNEIERIALSDRSPAPHPGASGRVDASFADRRVLTVGTAWWVATLGGLVLTAIGDALTSESDSDTQLRIGYACSAIGLLVLAIGSACGALYARRLGRRLAGDAVVRTP